MKDATGMTFNTKTGKYILELEARIDELRGALAEIATMVTTQTLNRVVLLDFVEQALEQGGKE